MHGGVHMYRQSLHACPILSSILIGVGNVGGVIELSLELNFFNLARNWQSAAGMYAEYL